MKYTPEFKAEVIAFAKESGFTEAWKKYKGIVYPDTIKRWIDPRENERAKQASAAYHKAHKEKADYKEKKRKLSQIRRESDTGKKYMEEYASTHREQLKENAQRHRQEHLEEYLQRQNQWYEDNKEHSQQSARKWYRDNSKYLNQLELQRYHSDPVTKLKWLNRTRLNQLIHQGKVYKKESSALKLLGCSLEELKEHLEKQFKPGMSWENHGEWHIDHIKPLSSFNLSLLEEQHKAFHYSNQQPLWKVENLQKGSTTPTEISCCS